MSDAAQTVLLLLAGAFMGAALVGVAAALWMTGRNE